MNESRLDEDLKALAKRPRPDLPPDFKATVWSKVQRQRDALACQTGELAEGFTLRIRDTAVGRSRCRFWTAGRLGFGPDHDKFSREPRGDQTGSFCDRRSD